MREVMRRSVSWSPRPVNPAIPHMLVASIGEVAWAQGEPFVRGIANTLRCDTVRPVKTETLAQRLGTTVHLSPLLMKARRLGLATPEDLERLAVRRGLRYYDCSGESSILREEPEPEPAELCADFSDEELAIALVSLSFQYSQMRLRMAAAVLATEGNSPEKLARLAVEERSEVVVVYIATCGLKVEPENPFWHTLLAHLPKLPEPRPDLLPHITRFVAMTGFTRRGKETIMQWIRPAHLVAV